MRFVGFIAVSAALATAAGVQAQPQVTTVRGNLIIGESGITSYLWEINDARGMAGPTGTTGQLVSGWSQIQDVRTGGPGAYTIPGNATWVATSEASEQFRLNLETLLNPSPVGGPANPGPMDGFHAPADNGGSAGPFPGDGDYAFVWPIITWQDVFSGPTDSPTLTADTAFDTSGFANPHPGTFSLQYDGPHKAIDLVYTPVPEPGALSLGILAAGVLALRRLTDSKKGK